MFFFSIEFGITFLLFFLAYWALKNAQSSQQLLLLVFNYFLLCYFGSIYVGIVLAAYTIFIYGASLAIARLESRAIFLTMCAFAVLNLSFFKYYASLQECFGALLDMIGINILNVEVVFPLGLSFYTFASITYLRAVFEARRLNKPNEPLKLKKHSKKSSPSLYTQYPYNSNIYYNYKLERFSSLAIYLSFFPTILAGPIMRSDFFFGQLRKMRVWERKNANIIIVLLLFGIVKKVLIATYLQEYTTPILSNPTSANTLSLCLGICGYGVQLYCDFSGYVNLVCAFALMLGFRLPPNFNMPYMAVNLRDFWARWHISLSTFIRDFIYIPLGGSRKGLFLTQIFVLISFGLSGIWHGNTINFMIWGLLHGVGLVAINLMRFYGISLGQSRISLFISSFLTFCFVSFAWIFFYYADINDSLIFLISLINNITMPIGMYEIFILFIGILIFVLYPYTRRWDRVFIYGFYKIPLCLKPIALGLILTIIFCLMPNGIPNFIYANF